MALGEMNGWSGLRDDLSKWLRDRGEVWSDLKYGYDALYAPEGRFVL
jgi:hypothetical protein